MGYTFLAHPVHFTHSKRVSLVCDELYLLVWFLSCLTLLNFIMVVCALLA